MRVKLLVAAKSLWADQASVSVTDSLGISPSKPPNDHFSGCFQHRNWCGIQVQDDGELDPVCYASRSQAQWHREMLNCIIGKEALATTWASEGFSYYVLGIPFTLETDHKPLSVLLNSSEFSKMSSRILCFHLRYNYKIQYVPPKHQVTADTLSHAPAGLLGMDDKLLIGEVEAFSTQTTSSFPAKPNRLSQIRDAQKVDEECSLLWSYCLLGWSPYLSQQPLLLGKQNPPHDCRWFTPVRWSHSNSEEYATTNRWLHAFILVTWVWLSVDPRHVLPYGGRDSPNKSVSSSPHATPVPRTTQRP